MNERLDLNGTWQLRWNDAQRGDKLERLHPPAADMRRAWDVQVPGEVHADLVELGLIPEPTLGLNALACRWVEECFWRYRRTFEVRKLAPGEKAELVFETLDLGAEIYLNGEKVAEQANAFHPLRVDVTRALCEGQNVLVVSVESGLFHAAEKPVKDLEHHFEMRLSKRPWLRKTHNSHSWDWAPRLLNVGITGSVHLEFAQSARSLGFSASTSLSDDLAHGTVRARAFVTGLSEEPVQARLRARLEPAGVERTVEVMVHPGDNELELALDVEKPALWWPVGHGDPALSTLELELSVDGEVIDKSTRRVGFRHVRVNQEHHPVSGRYFVIEVNKKPIFCKGGNFVPADIIMTRIDRARLTTLVDRALEANFNFLRVWGGGRYETDEFFELCNEKGILVWQEFIFACMRYPGTDAEFRASVEREAIHQIRRLAHHPCLVVWCGNNEMEWGSWDWGWRTGQIQPDHALFHSLFPTLLAREDPTKYYQPSSPYSLDHVNPNRDDTGDQHPWSIGFADGDFRKFREMICRFPNEGGILGPTALPTVLACLPEGMQKTGSFAWEFHDNSVSYWGGLEPYPDTMLRQWLGMELSDLSIEDYVYWGGVVQGAGLAEYIKNFRRRMFDSAAAVFWMYNDCWPAVRSWTVVDYYLRRTPTFWAVRRYLAPVAVCVVREDDQVRVYGINEGGRLTAKLRYGIMKLAGGYPMDASADVVLEPNSSTKLVEFSAAEWDALGVDSHVAFALLTRDGVELARDTLLLPLFKEVRWPEADVRVTVTNGEARFECDTLAWQVCLDMDGEEALGDNFFDVYPGVPTVLPWPESRGAPQVRRTGNELGRRLQA